MPEPHLMVRIPFYDGREAILLRIVEGEETLRGLTSIEAEELGSMLRDAVSDGPPPGWRVKDQ